jgi:hypothetical protein
VLSQSLVNVVKRGRRRYGTPSNIAYTTSAGRVRERARLVAAIASRRRKKKTQASTASAGCRSPTVCGDRVAHLNDDRPQEHEDRERTELRRGRRKRLTDRPRTN